MSETFVLDENVNDPKKVFNLTGPMVVTKKCELLRCRAIVIEQGFLQLNGRDGSIRLEVRRTEVDDPRTAAAEPTDAYHLGGACGRIRSMVGTGLQGDLAKIGSGAHDLTLEHVDGYAVAMEKPQEGGGAAGDKHQDGVQIMNAYGVTIGELNYTGGPSSNHAAFFCNPGGPTGDDTDPRTIHDCIVLGGTIKTKATGIALGACTRCGARNMLITAKFPFRRNEFTRQPVDEGNLIVTVS